MLSKGKNISLFLLDGEPNGRIKCTMKNWIGVMYKIPRTELDLCIDRPDLNQSGVYFLFSNSDNIEEEKVYIGQARQRKNNKGLLNRLKEHKANSDKDYWTEAIAITTSNDCLGPTELSYLENRFFNLAKKANRYNVKNGNDPNPGNITEEKKCELEEFIEYSKILIGSLGYKVFIPINENLSFNNSTIIKSNKEPILHLKKPNAEAKGCRTNEGFIVFKGSKVSQKKPKTCRNNIIKLREKYNNKINHSTNILKEDILFTSPSYAAAFVVYYNINGLTEWKDDSGKSLKDIEMENY